MSHNQARFLGLGRFAGMPAIGFLLLLTVVCPPVSATSPPFYGYYVSVSQPFIQPGGGGAPLSPMARPTIPRLLRQPGRKDLSGPGYVANCYSDDGTIPDNVQSLVTGSFFGATLSAGLTSCSQGSSFSAPLNLNSGGNPAGTGSGKITGNMAALSFSMDVGPQAYLNVTNVFVDYWYIQEFDSPVPAGTNLTFSWTVEGNGNMGAGISVISDCTVSCTNTFGTDPANPTQTITIGPSGTYTVVAEIGASFDPLELRYTVFPASYTATINMACAMKAIPTPPAGQIPALGLPGNNWSFNYAIGNSDGLEVTNVMLGNRPMAAMMSVPYVSVNTTDFNATNCLLEPDGSGTCASRLVYFESSVNSVAAMYVLANIPSGTSSCIGIMERFEFDQPVPGDQCEPSGNAGCGRFYPITSYQYAPDTEGKSVTEVDIPMRIQYTVGNPASGLLTTNQGQFSGIATDDNVTGFQNFFNGNPVQKEAFVPNVINQGLTGNADSFYQTYLPKIDAQTPASPPPAPDCPTCAQVHWRWPKMFTGFSGDNSGNPIIPPDSTQSVDVAIVAYPDQQQKSCSNLASGQQLAGQPTVFWYCGKGNQDSDSFFNHGGFFNAVSSTLQNLNITVKKGGFRIDHSTGYWVQTVTLTNTGGTVTGPVALVLDSLTTGVTLANADGTSQFVTPTGSPYVFLPLDSSSQLGPGQSFTVTLQFANPKNGAITYSTQVYAGGLL